jgi:hypothetical protein
MHEGMTAPGSKKSDGQVVADSLSELGDQFKQGTGGLPADQINGIDFDSFGGHPGQQGTFPGMGPDAPGMKPPATEWPMVSTLGESLNPSYPNTNKNATTGISDPGGPFRYESGPKPESGNPVKDLSDGEIDGGLAGLDALGKGSEAPAGTASAGPFQQVDIAPFEPQMPYNKAQLDAMTPEQRAVKEKLRHKSDDKKTYKPDGSIDNRGWQSPLSPPGEYGYDTPGAPAPGPGASFHGASGNTTLDANGKPQYNPAEVFSVSPPRKTYAVRGGPAGSYVDHIFNTRQEADAYAHMMSARSEGQIREQSAIKKAWNPLDAYRVFEIPPNTPYLRSSIAPQAESAPGYPSRYGGGGPQIQIPYGTTPNGSELTTTPIKNRVPEPAPAPTAAVTPAAEAPAAATPSTSAAAVPTDATAMVTPTSPAPATPVSTAAAPTAAAPAPTPMTPTRFARFKAAVKSGAVKTGAAVVSGAIKTGKVLDKTPQVIKDKTPESRLPEALQPYTKAAAGFIVDQSIDAWKSQSTQDLSLGMSGMVGGTAGVGAAMLAQSEQERKTVTVPVTPDYSPPPGTPQEVQALGQEIGTLEAKEGQVAGVHSKATREVKKGEENATTMQQVVAGTQNTLDTTTQHAQETDKRTQVNQQAVGTQAETQQTMSGFAEEAAGLATLKTMLSGFLTVLPVAEYIPSDRAKATARRMGNDATSFLSKLTGAEKGMAGLNATHGARKAELIQDKQQLAQTKAQNAQTQQKMLLAQEGAVALQDHNSERTDGAEKVRERAAQQRNLIKKDMQQRREQKEELSQKIAAWAQGHQDARKQAAAQTQAQLVAQGYEINEVKNV